MQARALGLEDGKVVTRGSTRGASAPRQRAFFRTMKMFACLCLFATLLAGCESDVARQGPRENPLQRGLRGEGQIVERDPLAESDLR